MIADRLSWGSRLFPEIRISVQTSAGASRLAVPPVAQAATLAALLILSAAFAYLGFRYVTYERVLAADERAAATAQNATVDLQDQLARLQDRLDQVTRDRGQAKDRLAAIESQLSAQRGEMQQQIVQSQQAETSKTGRIAELARALQHAQRDLFQLQEQRATLLARLAKLDADRDDAQQRLAHTKAGLDESAKKLQQLDADRVKAIGERDQMRARVDALQQKLSARTAPVAPQAAGAARPVAQAPASVQAPPRPVAQAPAPAQTAPRPVAQAPAPAQAAPRAVAQAPAPARAAPRRVRLAARGSALGEVERVLASAGVDVNGLFSKFGIDRAEGGPFVPPPKGMKLPNAISADKLAALRSLVKSLPIGAPVADYRLESGFGIRHDPFNRHAEFHTGIDLGGPYMTPVYATAAGVVSFAGYRPDYGKIVEIDHGAGLSTRYAHLHRFTVSVGERVAAHTQIGYLGSTGRSTGPHVHYEVLVNGEPQDPAKFLGLAEVIPAAAR
jgi:murein DD-endopeptidase MepM/ murein hydrolase activator NlpD